MPQKATIVGIAQLGSLWLFFRFSGGALSLSVVRPSPWLLFALWSVISKKKSDASCSYISKRHYIMGPGLLPRADLTAILPQPGTHPAGPPDRRSWKYFKTIL